MSTLSLRLPDSLHKAAKQFAEDDHISINQFITLAVAEKISSLNTEDILHEKSLSGNRNKFLKVLAQAPDIEPDDKDKL